MTAAALVEDISKQSLLDEILRLEELVKKKDEKIERISSQRMMLQKILNEKACMETESTVR